MIQVGNFITYSVRFIFLIEFFERISLLIIDHILGLSPLICAQHYDILRSVAECWKICFVITRLVYDMLERRLKVRGYKGTALFKN